MIPEVLVNLGLSPEETDIYLSLINSGPQSAGQLAKSTKVKRTYIYSVSAGLIKKGLISQTKKGKTTVFSAMSPDKLSSLVETKRQLIEQAENTLESIMPSLKEKFEAVDTRPVVTYYEGVEGIKKVYRDTLKEKREILALVETSEVDPNVYGWVTKEYVKQRVKNDIKVRAIASSGSKTAIYTGLNKEELRETKVVSSEKFPFKNEINIYGNKIAIINHKKGERLMGVIIDNKSVAETFRSWFELTWTKI